jgi:hypothetical protein
VKRKEKPQGPMGFGGVQSAAGFSDVRPVAIGTGNNINFEIQSSFISFA